MQGSQEVVVLRYGHRPGRDDRMTTHVGLTARALGADRVIFPDNATQAAETVADITDRFGGPFEIEQTDSQTAVVRNWDGPVVHLTMYGLPIQDVEAEVRTAGETDPLLVVVGGEKVPFELYEHADWNVGVTNLTRPTAIRSHRALAGGCSKDRPQGVSTAIAVSEDR